MKTLTFYIPYLVMALWRKSQAELQAIVEEFATYSPEQKEKLFRRNKIRDTSMATIQRVAKLFFPEQKYSITETKELDENIIEATMRDRDKQRIFSVRITYTSIQWKSANMPDFEICKKSDEIIEYLRYRHFIDIGK